MRMLFLTNFYPPASLGGYEQWCQEVADNLRARHQIAILTSRHGRTSLPADPDWVHRDLHLEMDLGSTRNAIQFFTARASRERQNLDRLEWLVSDFAPDVVLVWGMWNLHRSLASRVERLLPGRVAYYVGDYWPTLPSQMVHYWEAPARNWWSGVPKRVLGGVARRALARQRSPRLAFEHAMFPTRYMQAEYHRLGIVPRSARVVYGGVDTDAYGREPDTPSRGGIRSLLYVGRLTPEKGVHTAIEALVLLARQDRYRRLHLTIVGTGNVDEEAALHELVRERHLDDRVTFAGNRSKDDLRDFYQRADVLVFPSIWQEPFGRVIVEAMAAGVVVVGTATGGAAEILSHDENALVFPAGDASALADAVTRLADSEPLRARLADTARKQARERFSVDRMSVEIEAYLAEMMSSSPEVPSWRDSC